MTTALPITLDPSQDPFTCLQQAAANLALRLANLSADPDAPLDQIGKLQRAISGIFVTLKQRPKTDQPKQPKPEPEPEPRPAEPRPEPEPEPEPELEPEPEPEPEPDPHPKPKPKPKPTEPHPKSTPSEPPKPNPGPKPAPKPNRGPKPKTKPKPRTSKYLNRMRKKILHAKTYRSPKPR